MKAAFTLGELVSDNGQKFSIAGRTQGTAPLKDPQMIEQRYSGSEWLEDSLCCSLIDIGMGQIIRRQIVQAGVPHGVQIRLVGVASGGKSPERCDRRVHSRPTP